MANRLSYYAYGLCIGSDIPLPVSWQSSACRGNAQPDIEIYLGVVPAAPDDLKAASDLCRFDARRCWLHVPHVAHFWSEDGTRICVQPAEGADETTIAAFLVTSLIPTALAQQNKVIMPGSSISMPDGALLILGPSTIGKSTLAYQLYKQGYPLITDEFCLLSQIDGRIHVTPGYPAVALWLNMLELFEESPDHLERVRSAINKYYVPTPTQHPTTPQPVERIVMLGQSNKPEFAVDQLRGMHKGARLFAIMHTLNPASMYEISPRFGQFVFQMAQQLPMISITRPTHPVQLDDLMQYVLENAHG